MSSLCQVRADTNLAIEKFIFSIFLLQDFAHSAPEDVKYKNMRLFATKMA